VGFDGRHGKEVNPENFSVLNVLRLAALQFEREAS
jgi:hypothetical protein